MQVRQAVKRLLRAAYHLGAGPAYRRVRADFAGEVEAIRRAIREHRAEIQRMNRVYLDYHATMTQHLADELLRMQRALAGPAPTQGA